MSTHDVHAPHSASAQDGYPLQKSVAMLNRKLGLYLSPEQQKGFATGLLVGTAIAGALLAWTVGAALRRSD